MKLTTIALAIAFTLPSTFALARGGMHIGSHVTRPFASAVGTGRIAAMPRLLKHRDNARLFAQLSVYMTKAGRLNFDGKELAAQLIELGAPADFAYHTMR